MLFAQFPELLLIIENIKASVQKKQILVKLRVIKNVYKKQRWNTQVF